MAFYRPAEFNGVSAYVELVCEKQK